MPYFLFLILLLMQSLCAKSQCKDVYNNKVDCPTEEDSLIVYNNAIKIVQFYEGNTTYVLTRSVEITDIDAKQGVFEDLIQARRMFSIIRREVASFKDDKFSAGRVNVGYKDITYKQYYQEIDEYRFYQRELENQIINANAPMPIYDTRIAPILVNSYVCRDSSSVYFGDVVNIPLYIPVVVKPFILLTEPELVLRNKILHIVPTIVAPKKEMVKRDSGNYIVQKIITNTVEKDTILPVVNYHPLNANETPIYAFNQYGAGALIGTMVNRKFKKIPVKEYGNYAVPYFARELLSDDVQLDKFLRIKFGGYYQGLY